MARPKSITDEQIKEAAREVFVTHGPGASVKQIAAKLGVSHAALFGRMGTKEQLMLDALLPERAGAFAPLHAPPPTEGIEDALVDILIDLMAFFRRVVPNLVVLKAAGHDISARAPEQGPPPPVALRLALAGWLQEAQKDASLTESRALAIAEGLLGALEARCFNAYLGGSEYSPGDDAEFVKMIVAGLLPAFSKTTT